MRLSSTVMARRDCPSQNVLGGIVVGIRLMAAGHAHKHRLRAPVGLLGVSARMATLRGETRVYADDSPSSIYRFEGEKVEKLTPSNIVNRAGEVTLPHPLHVQVFMGDGVVAVDEGTGSLVVEVEPLPRHLAVNLGDVLLGLPAPLAAPLLAREGTLSYPEFVQGGLKEAGVA